MKLSTSVRRDILQWLDNLPKEELSLKAIDPNTNTYSTEKTFRYQVGKEQYCIDVKQHVSTIGVKFGFNLPAIYTTTFSFFKIKDKEVKGEFSWEPIHVERRFVKEVDWIKDVLQAIREGSLETSLMTDNEPVINEITEKARTFLKVEHLLNLVKEHSIASFSKYETEEGITFTVKLEDKEIKFITNYDNLHLLNLVTDENNIFDIESVSDTVEVTILLLTYLGKLVKKEKTA
ncbi:MAG: hypothetical protein M0R77_00380 [Gammaproteobacteria bacterium]|nr:hypothetical protein [Acholeplasmataceae bacterium]MCK9529010.1 hypothetical protein [Gammaproteobacteria bacterium]